MRAIGIGMLAVAALSLAGCGEAHSESGGGPRAERSYQVGPFQQIEVAGPYDVQVTTGGAPAVTASGPQNAIDRLVVEVRDNKLLIHPESHGFFTVGGWNGSVNVHVTAPALAAASLAGSGELQVDKVHGNSFEGNVAGSGDLTIGQASVQSLKLSIGGSGNILARSGKVAAVEYDIAGSGGIDARSVGAQNANVSVAGSGNVNAQASGTANVNIMGSGDVTLTGGAKCSVTKAGSGDARCS